MLPFETEYDQAGWLSRLGGRRVPQSPRIAAAEKPAQRPSPYVDSLRSALGMRACLRVEIMTAAQAALHQVAWRDLAKRAIEPNVFYEPGFALAAAQHLSEAGKPSFALVFADAGSGDKDLLGVFPFTASKLDLGVRIARGWRHPFNPSGTPLVDATHAHAVIDAFFDHMETTPFGTLYLTDIVHGPFLAALDAVTRTRGTDIASIGTRQRAILKANVPADTHFGKWRPKKLKELQRLRRRLDDAGPSSFRSATSASDVNAALERFLILEAAGWKGAYGSALVQDTGRATFVRVLARNLALFGGIRIDELFAGDTLVASGISLISSASGAFWKIAFDERFARYSPGVLLTQDMTRLVLESQKFDRIDSCAISDHPMIDHLWHDRVSVSDCMISMSRGGGVSFQIAVLREKARIGIRHRLRALKIRLKKSKNS